LPETNKKLVKIRAEIRCNELLDLLACTQNKNRREKICLVEKEEIISNLDYQKYCLAIEKTLQYIQAGDIYQANIAQRFSCFLPDGLSDIDLYQRLRQKNPAPFATYIRLGENRILSSSPERFIKVDNRQVLTCPIKGTTKRDAYFRRDQQLARHLSECQKNLAENLMIVDLMRNDLSRVCEFHSVNVPKLFCVESYAEVHHLVSTIEGRLKQEYDLIDLIKATFPGGSITGAPKIRAMEIIDEIETEARGPYCGIITYLNYDGRMDSSITIRSFVLKDKFLTFHVGGGIVADSAPSKEYIETILKASALYTALTEKRIKQYVSVAAKGISINA
jgi:para-aminobenzoate synthetase component 1